MAKNQFIETFREEAFELLGSLESRLLELEECPEDPELLSAVFRVMHTIKGSAAMFGLERIAGFSHDVESILVAARRKDSRDEGADRQHARRARHDP